MPTESDRFRPSSALVGRWHGLTKMERLSLSENVLAKTIDDLCMGFDQQADRIAELEAENKKLRGDFDLVTGWIAGIGSVSTEEEIVAGINLVPSVQEAWDRGLR